MAKFQSPLLGYNNNVRHRGRIFHIQTEDSGVNHPHIITHLFMDGGRILKSVKKSYAEHVGSETMSETVRVLMKDQHKAMFVALREGQYDSLFDAGKKPSGSLGVTSPPSPPSAPFSAAPAVGPPLPSTIVTVSSVPVSAEAKTEDSHVIIPDSDPRIAAAALVESRPAMAAAVLAASSGVPKLTPAATAATVAALPSPTAATVAAMASASAPPSSGPWKSPISRSAPPWHTTHERHEPAAVHERPTAVTPPRMPSADPPLPPELEALLRDELPPHPSPVPASGDVGRGAPGASSNAPTSASETRRPAQELTLDFDAIERDSGGSSIFKQDDLPPPPKNLFAKEPRTGVYSAVEADASRGDAARLSANKPPSGPRRTAPPPQRPPSTHPHPHAVSSPAPPAPEGKPSPASLFGEAPRERAASSIFSDDLVSDKSLDEVILSYLAEDLEPPRRK